MADLRRDCTYLPSCVNVVTGPQRQSASLREFFEGSWRRPQSFIPCAGLFVGRLSDTNVEGSTKENRMPALPEWMLWVACGYGLMSLVTLVVYGVDKRRAQRGRSRIPERSLHLLELLGGWPGAVLGQVMFRHKLRKPSYMVVFAGIVALHAAFWGWYYYRHMR